jgi:hypothetical protein
MKKVNQPEQIEKWFLVTFKKQKVEVTTNDRDSRFCPSLLLELILPDHQEGMKNLCYKKSFLRSLNSLRRDNALEL